MIAAAACSPSLEKASDQPNSRQTPVQTPDPNASITEQRQHIDELDKQIIELLRQRGEASATIQRIRTAAGGTRTDPTREQQILGRYQDGLGPAGRAVASAILDADRGAAPSTTASTTGSASPTSTAGR